MVPNLMELFFMLFLLDTAENAINFAASNHRNRHDE